MLSLSKHAEGAPALTHDGANGYSPPPAFGPFRVLHQVGVGVFGPVFRTYEPGLDRLVAVKVFRLDITPEQARELADELQRVADLGLSHPSLVPILGAGVEGSVAYAALDYVAAESLDVAMRHYAPAPVDRVLPFITQIAGAIDFAAAAKLHHGALHPRDIFVTPEVARAAGFGIAQAVERVGSRCPVRRPYSAPERIEGGEWSAAADVFALAAIAFELFTGRRVAGTGADAASRLEVQGAPDLAALVDVFSVALAEVPGERFPTALSFAAALESAAQEVPAVAEPPVPRPPRPVRKRRSTPAPAAVLESRTPAEPSLFADDGTIAERADATEFAAEVELQRDSSLPTSESAFEAAAPREGPPDAPPSRMPPIAPAALVAPALLTPQLAASTPPASHGPIAPIEARIDLTDVEEPLMPPAHAIDRGKSAMLPVAIGVMVGVLVGFIAGYGLGTRERAGSSAAGATVSRGAQAPPAAAGQAWSDTAVADSPTQSGIRAGAPPPAPPVPAETAPPRTTAVERRGPSAPVVPVAPVPDGRLLVRSTPAGAVVAVDGRNRGTTPLALRELPFGTYSVRVTRAGHAPGTSRITLSRAQPAGSLSFDLRPIAPPRSVPAVTATGAIVIESRPRGARVFVDGALVGSSPLMLSNLKPGLHQVRIEYEGYRRWDSTVRVTPGGRNRVAASLVAEGAR